MFNSTFTIPKFKMTSMLNKNSALNLSFKLKFSRKDMTTGWKKELRHNSYNHIQLQCNIKVVALILHAYFSELFKINILLLTKNFGFLVQASVLSFKNSLKQLIPSLMMTMTICVLNSSVPTTENIFFFGVVITASAAKFAILHLFLINDSIGFWDCWKLVLLFAGSCKKSVHNVFQCYARKVLHNLCTVV